MQKYLLHNVILAFALLAVASSCTESNETGVILSDYEIQIKSSVDVLSFSSTATKSLTKAANKNNDNFRIVAYYYDFEKRPELFSDVFSPGDNTYDPSSSGKKYYWPTNDSNIDIVGYAPASSSYIESDASNKKIIFQVPQEANVDLTVAQAITNQERNPKTNQPVAVHFNHVLSAAELSIVLSGSEYPTLYGMTLESATVEFQVRNNFGTVDITQASPTMVSSDDINNAIYTRTFSANNTVSEPIYFIPQSVENCLVTLKNITVRDPKTDAEVELYIDNHTFTPCKIALGEVANDKFEQGLPYNIKLTLNHKNPGTTLLEEGYAASYNVAGFSSRIVYLTLDID